MTQLSAEFRRLAGALKRGAHPSLLAQLELAVTALPSNLLDVSLRSLEFGNRVGCPAWLTAQNIAEQLEFKASLASQVAVASSSALYTVKLLRWLPWLGLAGVQLLGLNPIGFLVNGALGYAVLVLALGLAWLASFIQNRQLEKARVVADDPGIWLAIAAKAFGAGVPVGLLIDELTKLADTATAETHRVETEVLAGLCQTGNLAEQLAKAADTVRGQARQVKLQELERLPQKLLLPVGLVSLPQFLLLLVVPTLAGAVTAF
jgi:hypothetical protein